MVTTLKGTINSLMADSEIPDGCVLRILLFDGSDRLYLHGSANSKLIEKMEIFNPKIFPIEYELEFPKPTNKKLFYFLSVYIEKNSHVLYDNKNVSKLGLELFSAKEFGDVLSSANNLKLRKSLDVFLNKS